MLKRFLAALLAFLAVGPLHADVIINEIHYDPDVKTELVEFIEFYNTGASAVDVSGWLITDAVDYTFPAGTSIAANGYLVVCQNPTHFNTKFKKTALGPWTGSLKNEGETIVLRDPNRNIIDQVNFQLGFPWPTVGDPPGFSIELANPAFDNDLGGNWRPSGTPSNPASDVTIIPKGAVWKYFKGTQEPSATTGAWRALNFTENSSWLSGAMPIGYDPSVPMNTTLSDMVNNYSTVYFRKTFNISDPNAFGSLQVQAMYDDGFKVWINGRLLIYPAMNSAEMTYDSIASGSARESSSYDTFNLPVPVDYLVAGQNIIAIQAANILLSGSSDFFLDLALIGRAGTAGIGPTPGARNNSFTDNLPPAIRQVDNSPSQPSAGQPVTITAKVTDPDGVASVQLQYQIVDPGNYIELTDPAYATSWTTVPMADAGTGGDEFAGDSVYTAVLPGSLQIHRRLVRYRITATDGTGKSITAPYNDDPVPNFAYFCYNGVPTWTGAAQPGVTSPVTFPTSVMTSLPVYHLISKKASVEASTWNEKYGGDLYKWSGTLVYDGKVYDHIHYRARGGVWRYAMGKNMWKMDFNHGHEFQAKDGWGRDYPVTWTKLNLGACIQQGNFLHRGEQGMFESTGFRLFNLAGLEVPLSHFIQFRIIDDPSENGADQYSGDFWGLYLALEQEDSRFLQAHNLPDSNFYKMEGGTGTLNNQGQYGPTDRSDLNAFIAGYQTSEPESWWRSMMDVRKYYSYRTIVEGIHHYDIDQSAGKNYFFFTNEVSHLWETHAWDLDLTWADNMYGGGDEPFRSRVLPLPNFSHEYKNRIREIRDLLYNTDQAYKLIDEQAAQIYTPGAPSMVGADRAHWDYNPIMINYSIVTQGKADQGRFYESSPTRDFPGMVQLMKSYIVSRGSYLDSLASDPGLPDRPTISNLSSVGNPGNKLSFQASAYSGGSAFAAMQWRIGEITPANHPAFEPSGPHAYEITAVWESPELTAYAPSINVPNGLVKVGHTYRARIKMKDSVGRWSNWSAPVEFIAGEADNVTALVQNLRVTEIMYNPPAGNDYEFIELYNSSADTTLDLSGVKFTSGIDFTFPTNSLLAPKTYCLVTRTPAPATFRAYYNVPAAVQIYGPYSGSLSNDGEELTLKTTAAGAVIVTFVYGDGALWPSAADGAGHSIVPKYLDLVQSDSDFSYPGNWQPSANIKGSPGRDDSNPTGGLVINEIMANTTFSDSNFPRYDSNDWIELANAGNSSIDFNSYYLSDDPLNLKKWALPAGSLAPGALVVYNEVTGFHSPITVGFGLDQAGEGLYLSYLPGNSQDRVVDAIKFKGQSPTASWSRVPNATGFWRSATPTKGAANGPATLSIVISEVMYHPATNANTTIDNTTDEYVELYNPTAAAITLSDNFGAWHIDGGIGFDFPSGTTVGAGETLLLVNFSPTVTASSNAFRAKYNLPANAKILGPYSGKLGNDSDRISLERPQPPKAAGEPVAWIVVDEMTYGNRPLWPADADGLGASLHRISPTASGNDPTNWQNAAPDAGVVPITDVHIASALIQSGQFTARVQVAAGKTYTLQRCDDITTHQWQAARILQATAAGLQDFTDPDQTNSGNRFYRIQVQ